jgi:hypothetical protein
VIRLSIIQVIVSDTSPQDDQLLRSRPPRCLRIVTLTERWMGDAQVAPSGGVRQAQGGKCWTREPCVVGV